MEELLWKHGRDILTSPGMERERSIPQHGYVNCFDHSVAVALLSVWIAARLGLHMDMRSLVRGALLHDYFLYNWRVPDPAHRLHGFCHGRLAMENAERDFGLNPVEADIIRRHMFPLTPIPPCYCESAVVCCADKLCAMREMASGLRLWLLRGLPGKVR